jgi:hypothetical protein
MYLPSNVARRVKILKDQKLISDDKPEKEDF